MVKNQFQYSIFQILFFSKNSLKYEHPFFSFFILWCCQMLIIATIVPWIERVKAYNIASHVWQFRFVVLQNIIHVFVMTPGHHQIVNATVRLINTMFRIIFWIFAIRIANETIFSVDYAIAPSATDLLKVENKQSFMHA